MLASRLINSLLFASFLVLPAHAAQSVAISGKAMPAGICASLTTCEETIDHAVAAKDTESLAMALWRKIALLLAAGKREEANAMRAYLEAVLNQAFSPDHPYALAARNAVPEAAMQALLPAWLQKQQLNAELAVRRGPVLERLRAGKNMVKIAEAYVEIGKYEVTQAEWDAVMGTDPSYFSGCADCPVENIDGDTVRAFLAKLNQLTGRDYRLPTDEEWRRVFDAGFSGSADDNAWHAGNSGGRTHPVGQKKPNALGLYDLRGNVAEWVVELHYNYKRLDDGALKASGSAWDGKAVDGFWSWTQKTAPYYPTLGFRLARSLERPKKALPACHDLSDAPKPAASSVAPLASLPKGFRDCPDCPEMVAIAAGQGMNDAGNMVAVPTFAIARTEITVGQFRRFVEATGHLTTAERGRRCSSAMEDWRRPGHPQTDAHPAVCITGDDAQAYVDWLSKRTGKTYAIPTHMQWEHAARGGNTDMPWAGDIETACRYANLDDRCLEATDTRENASKAAFPCIDGYAYPAPVARFPPNAFGLYDMIGNVEEWAGEKYCPYEDCRVDVMARGGGVSSGPRLANFTSITNWGEQQSPNRGFRPVRELAH